VKFGEDSTLIVTVCCRAGTDKQTKNTHTQTD